MKTEKSNNCALLRVQTWSPYSNYVRHLAYEFFSFLTISGNCTSFHNCQQEKEVLML